MLVAARRAYISFDRDAVARLLELAALAKRIP